MAKCIASDANRVGDIESGALFFNEQYARGIVAVDPILSPTSYMPNLCIERGGTLRQSTFEAMCLAQTVQCALPFFMTSLCGMLCLLFS